MSNVDVSISMNCYLRHIYILRNAPSDMNKDGEDAIDESSNSDSSENITQKHSIEIEDWGENPLNQGTYLFIWALASIASFAIFVIFF